MDNDMGMINQASAIRVDYDYEKKKWFVDTPIVMSKGQLVKVLLHARGQLLLRAEKEINPRKRDMMEALRTMSPETTDQYLLGNGEKTLYLGPNVKL
jgi:hypothetical protein